MRKLKKLRVMVFLACLVIATTAFANAIPDHTLCRDLVAGQNYTVGEVCVWNDADNLYVAYHITQDGVCLTETHLHVATGMGEDTIPQTKKGNPIPGQFDYSQSHNCVTEYIYEVPLTWTCDESIQIAAHAVVVGNIANGGTVCAAGVQDVSQGTYRDGSPIETSLPNSNPKNALYEPDSTIEDTGSFFSLGFGGSLVLDFGTLVGGQLNVYETTWNRTSNPYPLEQAEVSVSRDGADWTALGTASNSAQTAPGTAPVPNVFDLPMCIQYVKIVDVTTDSAFPVSKYAKANGFDIDAACASYNCSEETAWADGEPFSGKNWATWFTYIVGESCEESYSDPGTLTLWQIGTPDGNVNPQVGSVEYPAWNKYYNEYDYCVGDDSDPIGSPSMPGYIGSDTVCNISPRDNCTDTTMVLNIGFELNCCHDADDLVLIYDRYGSETDTLYFDGEFLIDVKATEGGFAHFEISLPAVEFGFHVITIAYEGGGDANGHYIDYLKLIEVE